MVIVAWKKVCKPYDQGGLGIKSIVSLNVLVNLKLCWHMVHSEESCSALLISRLIGNDREINHNISSSLWSSLKNDYNVILESSTWLLRNGQNINFCSNYWWGEPLINLHLITNFVLDVGAKVYDFIQNSQWNFIYDFTNNFP